MKFKIFFSRTTWPISTKLGTEHCLVKGIQVCSKEGSRPFPRGDNYEIVKIHWQNLKTSSPEPLSKFQPNLAQSILGWRGFKFIQMKGFRFFKRGDNNEMMKIHCRNLKKNFSPEPMSQFRPNLAQSILGWREFKFVQIKGPALFQEEIITK